MSGSYASRLSEYKNKGACGLPERFDNSRTMSLKMKKLIQLVKQSKFIVVLTGAGISTSAGIPDFRGPSGIWTKEKEAEATEPTKKTRKKSNNALPTTKKRKCEPTKTVDFNEALPALTHRALVHMVNMKKIQFIITQNVDGLHKRSGLSRDHLAVLHGCVFTEVCNVCRMEYYRDFDVGGISFSKTGRKCDICQEDLRDCLLDWEDELPQFDLERAEQNCRRADLVLALGTSLRIEPAGSLPTLGEKMIIVNLQQTPYDTNADLIINGHVDDVMQQLLEGLGEKDWDTNVDPVKIERTWRQPKPVEDHS